MATHVSTRLKRGIQGDHRVRTFLSCDRCDFARAVHVASDRHILASKLEVLRLTVRLEIEQEARDNAQGEPDFLGRKCGGGWCYCMGGPRCAGKALA